MEQDQNNNDHQNVAKWAKATVGDIALGGMEGPIADINTVDCRELGVAYSKAAAALDESATGDCAALRVFMMLGALTSMHLRPGVRAEPFGPLFVFSDGQRSAILEDFRGEAADALVEAATRAKNIVLQARLCDIGWMLNRKRFDLGLKAISAYTLIVQKLDRGELTSNTNLIIKAVYAKGRDLLRRALQIGVVLGRKQAEFLAARELVIALRIRSLDDLEPVAIRWFFEIDLDFELSNPSEVAEQIENFLLKGEFDHLEHIVVPLWRLAARGYHYGGMREARDRCKLAAAKNFVKQSEASENEGSALAAAHWLGIAIAELHGHSDVKEFRLQLRHKLIDIQSRIPDEMSSFSHPMDIKELVLNTEAKINGHSLRDLLFIFADIARSPSPSELIDAARDSINKFPMAHLFGSSHHDYEGKVIYRSPAASADADVGGISALRSIIAKHEEIRREAVVGGEIDVVRRSVNAEFYVSEDIFRGLLRYSPFVPNDVLETYSHAFTKFFHGDYICALYVLTPLLENSFRYVLRQRGIDVTKFDDATQVQEDRSISSMFEQLRSELEDVFGKALIFDVENVFLMRPGPCLRHAVAHGLLNDGSPYCADAIYGCWLIFRLCFIPLFPQRESLVIVT